MEFRIQNPEKIKDKNWFAAEDAEVAEEVNLGPGYCMPGTESINSTLYTLHSTLIC